MKGPVTLLYSSIFGEVRFLYLMSCSFYPIICKVIRSGSTVSFTEDGKCSITDAESTLFPSKTQRDWSKFGMTDQESKRQLNPFIKVLVQNYDNEYWELTNLFSYVDEHESYFCLSSCWKQCIPYEGNENLLGTNKPSNT